MCNSGIHLPCSCVLSVGSETPQHTDKHQNPAFTERRCPSCHQRAEMWQLVFLTLTWMDWATAACWGFHLLSASVHSRTQTEPGSAWLKDARENLLADLTENESAHLKKTKKKTSPADLIECDLKFCCRLFVAPAAFCCWGDSWMMWLGFEPGSHSSWFPSQVN